MNNVPTNKNTRLFKGLNDEKSAGLAFSASIVLVFIFSMLLGMVIIAAGLTKNENYNKTDWYLYCSYLLPQIAFIIIAILYFVQGGNSVKKTIGKPKAIYILLAIILQFGLFSLSSLNSLFLTWLEKFGYQPSEVLIPGTNGAKVIPVLFVIAVLPACMEELFFRGILFKGLKKGGGIFSILLCAALFSLYHQSPVQTAYQFVCGACFALIAYRSGSIVPTIISHFLNNACIVILYAIGKTNAFNNVAFLCVSAVCLVGVLVYLIFIDKTGKKTAEDNSTQETSERVDKKGFFLYALVGIVLCAVSWITNLVSGF